MNHKRNQGFTLIEIAVVVFVIGIIASIIVVSFIQVQKESRDRRRTSDVVAIENALSAYFRDNNEYPPVCSGDNVGCDVSNLSSSLVPKYIPSIPVSPNGSHYNYVRGTQSTSSASYGILVSFETQAQCKGGVNVSTGWWGTAIPVCGSPL